MSIWPVDCAVFVQPFKRTAKGKIIPADRIAGHSIDHANRLARRLADHGAAVMTEDGASAVRVLAVYGDIPADLLEASACRQSAHFA